LTARLPRLLAVPRLPGRLAVARLRGRLLTEARLLRGGLTITRLCTTRRLTVARLLRGRLTIARLLRGGLAVLRLLRRRLTVTRLLCRGLTVARLLLRRLPVSGLLRLTVARLLLLRLTVTTLLGLLSGIAGRIARGVVATGGLVHGGYLILGSKADHLFPTGHFRTASEASSRTMPNGFSRGRAEKVLGGCDIGVDGARSA